MATYKVIQDIEAEDKFLGPLTIKQFVFAAIGAVFGWLVVLIGKEAWFIGILFVPVSLFGFFMAIPWSKDQPTDVWVLAKLRFKFKPKARIWDQAGQQDLVTITAPKKVEKVYTKDISEAEVKSRLKVLADTMNTRGWALKRASTTTYRQFDPDADRLLDTPIPVGSNPVIDDGILDEFEDDPGIENLITEKEKAHRQAIKEEMDLARAAVEDLAPPKQSPNIIPEDADSLALEKELAARKKAKELATSRMSRIKTNDGELSDKTEESARTEKQEKSEIAESKKESTSTVTQESSPDIIKLAHNNDFDVATLSRQANQDEDESKEVVVSLH